MTLAFDAMQFARNVHKDQRRKYTGNPYADHLAEVAGIVATVAGDLMPCFSIRIPGMEDYMIAVAWLHDCIEDQGIRRQEISDKFGGIVASGVWLLSDMEEGNRAERKALARERLSQAPGWVQTIKCADLISNTASIVQHDPKFAATYLEETRMLLDVLTEADWRLHALAREQIA